MLSPNGRCAIWDRAADGYARGEGVAAVVLKTLSRALADGDHIECIIRETGVNQDGRTTGLTMPSNTAQTALIRDTYRRAGLDINEPHDRPQFFHAHGTGTQAGDPQEAEAVSAALFPNDSKDHTELFVGSIKTVIGHTEGSAGLASLIGSSLAMKHGIVPPNLHFSELSDKVAPFYTNLKIPTEPMPWPKLAPGQVKRASINSFGEAISLDIMLLANSCRFWWNQCPRHHRESRARFRKNIEASFGRKYHSTGFFCSFRKEPSEYARHVFSLPVRQPYVRSP